MSWLDDAKRADLLDVAAELGTEIRGKNLATCPACGATGHGSGNVYQRNGVQYWKCHRCNVSGSGLDLVALETWRAVLGSGDRERWAELRAWYAQRGWCESAEDGVSAPATMTRAPRPPAAPEPPRRPPSDEVKALWDATVPISGDAEIESYLRGRGFDPGRVAQSNLARALPVAAAVPSWAWFGQRTWAETGHRLLVPLYGPTGAMESLRARAVTSTDAPSKLAPKGYEVRGLVTADTLGRELLRTGELPSWWPPEQTLQTWVTEGETDFLAMAVRWMDSADTIRAVLGVMAGSWTPDCPAVAARIPDGTVVVVATDPDDAGDEYAEQIRKTLAGRDVAVKRYRLKREP